MLISANCKLCLWVYFSFFSFLFFLLLPFLRCVPCLIVCQHNRHNQSNILKCNKHATPHKTDNRLTEHRHARWTRRYDIRFILLSLLQRGPKGLLFECFILSVLFPLSFSCTHLLAANAFWSIQSLSNSFYYSLHVLCFTKWVPYTIELYHYFLFGFPLLREN